MSCFTDMLLRCFLYDFKTVSIFSVITGIVLGSNIHMLHIFKTLSLKKIRFLF